MPTLPDDVVRKLIAEVKIRECLWNSEHENYNDRSNLRKTWGEISEILQVDSQKLRMKWKNLRDIFKKEYKRYAPLEKYRGKWRYYKEMQFIQNDSTTEPIESKDETEEEAFTYEEDEVEFVQQEEQEIEICYSEPYDNPLPGAHKRRKMTDDDDYDVMFLKSLAPYFKQLDPVRKLVVRSQMQDLLLNEIGARASTT